MDDTVTAAVGVPQRNDYDDHDDLEWFRDELRQRDREIANLRREKDELTDQVRRFSEYIDGYKNVLERWQQAYHALVRCWNRIILLIGTQDIGRQ